MHSTSIQFSNSSGVVFEDVRPKKDYDTDSDRTQSSFNDDDNDTHERPMTVKYSSSFSSSEHENDSRFDAQNLAAQMSRHRSGSPQTTNHFIEDQFILEDNASTCLDLGEFTEGKVSMPFGVTARGFQTLSIINSETNPRAPNPQLCLLHTKYCNHEDDDQPDLEAFNNKSQDDTIIAVPVEDNVVVATKYDATDDGYTKEKGCNFCARGRRTKTLFLTIICVLSIFILLLLIRMYRVKNNLPVYSPIINWG